MSRRMIYDTDEGYTKRPNRNRTPLIYRLVRRYSFGLITTQRGADMFLLCFIVVAVAITYVQLNNVLSPAEAELVPPLAEGLGI